MMTILFSSILPSIVLAGWAVYTVWLKHPEKVTSHFKIVVTSVFGFVAKHGPLACFMTLTALTLFSDWPLERNRFILIIQLAVMIPLIVAVLGLKGQLKHAEADKKTGESLVNLSASQVQALQRVHDVIAQDRILLLKILKTLQAHNMVVDGVQISQDSIDEDIRMLLGDKKVDVPKT